MGRRDKDRENNKRRSQVPKELSIQPLPPQHAIDIKEIVRALAQKVALSATVSAVAGASTVTLDNGPEAKALVEIALNSWRLKRRMEDPETHEPIEGMGLYYRHVDAIQKGLDSLGLTIKDPTNETYGAQQKAIAFEPTPGIQKETVVKTIKPTIQFRGQLLERGEVIVGTPMSQESHT